MEFFRQTTIDFMKIRGITALVSIMLIIFSILSISLKGLNWGLDFTGGTVIDVSFSKDIDINNIRNLLKSNNYLDAQVQTIGNNRNLTIKLAPRKNIKEQKIAKALLDLIKQKYPDVNLKKVDAVGSQVGKEITHQGILAMVIAMLATIVYIGLRFERKFALSSLVALAHDPIIILGIFSFYQIEFDLTALAAILAVIGYSLNDTIVVFDRIKENFIKIRNSSTKDMVNLSINQTLSRTIMTSGLTSLVVIALLLKGGPTLFGFSLAFFIGIIIGTYSSIYIAGALSLSLGLSKFDLLPKKKQNDGMP